MKKNTASLYRNQLSRLKFSYLVKYQLFFFFLVTKEKSQDCYLMVIIKNQFKMKEKRSYNRFRVLSPKNHTHICAKKYPLIWWCQSIKTMRNESWFLKQSINVYQIMSLIWRWKMKVIQRWKLTQYTKLLPLSWCLPVSSRGLTVCFKSADQTTWNVINLDWSVSHLLSSQELTHWVQYDFFFCCRSFFNGQVRILLGFCREVQCFAVKTYKYRYM